jgi:hypothetical protein
MEIGGVGGDDEPSAFGTVMPLFPSFYQHRILEKKVNMGGYEDLKRLSVRYLSGEAVITEPCAISVGVELPVAGGFGFSLIYP